MPSMEIINTLIIPIFGCICLFGTIITVKLVGNRTKLRLKEYELEQMRLANEAKQMELEEHRLRIMMVEQEENKYKQLGR